MDLMRFELTLQSLEESVLPVALQARRPFITLGFVVQGSTFILSLLFTKAENF
jgi:hypothetical protein